MLVSMVHAATGAYISVCGPELCYPLRAWGWLLSEAMSMLSVSIGYAASLGYIDVCVLWCCWGHVDVHGQAASAVHIDVHGLCYPGCHVMCLVCAATKGYDGIHIPCFSRGNCWCPQYVLPLETKHMSLAHADAGAHVVHAVPRNNVKVHYPYFWWL